MDGLIALFLFPAFAGYIVLTRTMLYSIRTHSYSMPRLFAESVVFGIGLLYLSSFFLCMVQNSWELPPLTFGGIVGFLWQGLLWPLRNELTYQSPGLTASQIKAHLTNEAIAAILIAGLYVAIAQLLASRIGKPLRRSTNCPAAIQLYDFFNWLVVRHENKILKERDRHGGTVERFFALSMNSFTPVQITMRNRKIYVGFIRELPPLSPQNKQQRFVNIFPILSGYRDSDTLALSKKITDYDVITDLLLLMGGNEPSDPAYAQKLKDIHSNMDPTLAEHLDMGIAIDAEEIIAVSLWDGGIFQHFITAP